MAEMAHDPAGWLQFCRACSRAYWAAWQPSGARVRRMELDRMTPHKCLAETQG